MEEEINLRRYVRVLIHHWKWIAGITLIAAIVALAVSFTMPPSYEATALVAIIQPRYIMQFDSRFQTVGNVQPAYKAYPELATSDALLQALLDQLSSLPNKESIATLSQALKANAGADPSLIRLTASSPDKKEAAHIANTWAELFVKRANEIYGASNTEQLGAFETQLQRARAELEASEQALINFEAHNQVTLFENKLAAYNLAHADYLTSQHSITTTLQNVVGLRNQLAQQPQDARIGLADQLTVILLQLQAFNAQAIPIQFQISDIATPADKSLDEQIAFLDDLASTLKLKSFEISLCLADLEPHILETQQQLQQAQTAQDRLTRDRDVAKETYITLARKTEEIRISAQSATGDAVRLASKAAIPEKPAGPRKAVNTAIAGILGLVLAILGVSAIEWWRGETEPVTEQEIRKEA